jgi:aryl-alcohol dehydrogenase-like predicted oxidoreductase
MDLAPMSRPAEEDASQTLDAVALGLGASSWGDRVVWQYGRAYGDEDISRAFHASVDEGAAFIDTSEVYGSGRSERIVGRLVAESKKPVLVATKFFPWPWRITRLSVLSALRASLARLGRQSVSLYQVQMSTPLFSPERMMEAMLSCVDAGLTTSIGVCNFSESEMLRAYSTLARRNFSLAASQVHYSLLRRRAEKTGLLMRCKELGIRVIAYSPLEMGLLTGKYGPDNPPPGNRRSRYAYMIGRVQPLLQLMTQIGQDHGGKSNAQVALNWVIRKGALPIPGAKNEAQALENAGALGWSLTDAEVGALDLAADEVA